MQLLLMSLLEDLCQVFDPSGSYKHKMQFTCACAPHLATHRSSMNSSINKLVIMMDLEAVVAPGIGLSKS